MKKFLGLVVALLVCASAHAQSPKVEAVMAKDQDTKPTDSFAADVPKLYAFFRTQGTKSGDKLRSVWIADDVGDAAPKNTKIDEATVALEKDNGNGAFSMSKPTKGWPVGEYHVDIYYGDNVATTVKFKINAGKDKDDDDDDDKD